MSPPTTKDDAGQLCVPCFINGKQVVQPSTAGFPVVSARKQEVIHYGQTATADIAKQAVDAAHATFKTYKNTSVNERRRLLLRAAELFDEKSIEGYSRQMSETSCDEAWGKFNAVQMGAFCREFASFLKEAVTGSCLPSDRTGLPQIVLKQPVGPILFVIPWNGALVLGVRGVAAALAAGCTVVMKASELCPWTHTFIAEIFMEAGFPPGSVNLVMSDRSSAAEVTEAIIAHPALRKIEFIGSAGVGKVIGALAAKYLKPILMELGDQSPAIILEDANLENAADLCAKGALLLHGQVCFSTERIIAHSSIKDEFCRHLAAAFKANPVSGFAITNAFAEKSKAVVDDAVQRGAKLIHGDNAMTGPASVNPSILVDVDRSSAISKNEAFAPTLFITSVSSDEEAIAEANSREGGLSASVFTADQERGWKMARELEFGQVQINNLTLYADPSAPVTGWKGSGWGSHGGRYGIEEYLQNKCITMFPSK